MPKIQVQIPNQRFPSNLKQLLDWTTTLGSLQKRLNPPTTTFGENNINIFSYIW
jgi:hypothetical protein